MISPADTRISSKAFMVDLSIVLLFSWKLSAKKIDIWLSGAKWEAFICGIWPLDEI